MNLNIHIGSKVLLSEKKESEEAVAESVLGWYLSLMGTE